MDIVTQSMYCVAVILCAFPADSSVTIPGREAILAGFVQCGGFFVVALWNFLFF